MSEIKVSDSFLGNLIDQSVGAALSDVIPLATNLVEARAEITRLSAELDKARAEQARWYKNFDDVRQLSWIINNYDGYAENLERHANEIDCGQGCEYGFNEHDTNAFVCSKSNDGECPFDTASELRDLARSIRTAKVTTDRANSTISDLQTRYEARLADANQAVGALIYAVGLSDNADCIRLQDILAYGKTEDGIDLLPWPRDPEALARDSDVVRLTAERDEARKPRTFSEDRSVDLFTACSLIAEMFGMEMPLYPSEQLVPVVRQAKLRSDATEARYDALLAERAGVSEAFRFGTPTDALYNLEGTLCDLDRMEADPICRATIRRVIKQLSPLRAALSTPVPAPVDRDAIRAEACEHDLVEMPDGYGMDVCCKCGMRGAAIRSAAKTEASR